MWRVVCYFNKAENSSLSNADILKRCRVSESEFESWFRDFEIREINKDGSLKSSRNLFDEWWKDVLQIKSGEEKEMLRLLGMKKAMDGDYRYWKDMSLTYGARSPDAIVHTHRVVTFNLDENATPEQLKEARQKLLDSQRAVDDRDRDPMAGASAVRPKGATS